MKFIKWLKSLFQPTKIKFRMISKTEATCLPDTPEWNEILNELKKGKPTL